MPFKYFMENNVRFISIISIVSIISIKSQEKFGIICEENVSPCQIPIPFPIQIPTPTQKEVILLFIKLLTNNISVQSPLTVKVPKIYCFVDKW